MKKQSSNSLWYLLGLRSSLSLRVSLLFFIPGTLSPIFIDRASYGGPTWFWIALILSAHLAFTIVLLISQRIVHGTDDSLSKPTQTLVAFIAAQSVRGIVLGYGIVAQGLTDNPQLAFRILSGGVYIEMILSVIAIGVAIYDQHTSLVGRLQDRNQQLNLLRNSLNNRLDSATASLQEFARTVVEPRIQQIDKLISDLQYGGDSKVAIDNLRDYVDNELRPFSHEIAHVAPANPSVVEDLPKVRGFRLPEYIMLGDVFRPFVTTMLLGITCVSASQRSMSLIESLPFNVVSIILIFIYFLGIKYIFRNVRTAFLLSYAIAIPIFAIISPVVLWVDVRLGIKIPEFISQASAILGVIFAFSNVTYSFLTAQRTSLVDELTLANEELSSVVAVIGQKEWLARRRVSFVMHGSLQSALNAAALRLGANPNPDQQLIDTMRQDIAAALKRIGFDGPQEYTFEIARKEITEIWNGTIEITWSVGPDVELRLARNPATSECVAEVLREVVSNASKHGSATKVDVAIEVNENIVEIEIIDNGTASNTGVTQGLGTELFDDVCLTWKLESGARLGKTFHAQLAVDRVS